MTIQELASALAGDGDVGVLVPQLLSRLPSAAGRDFDVMLEAVRERQQRDGGDVLYRAKLAIGRARGQAIGLRTRVDADETFADYDDDGLVWAAIYEVWDAASIYNGADVLARDLLPASPMQRGLFGLWWTRSEVANGGLSQYFANATAVVAPYVSTVCAQLGATRSHAVFAKALALFGDAMPLDRERRCALLDEIDEAPLSQLSDELLPAIDTEAYPAAARYVRSHPDEFFDR